MIRDQWIAFFKWFVRFLLRKPTVVFHVLLGFLCAILSPWFPLPSTLAIVMFSVFEWWQAEVDGDCGHLDFWDGVLGYGIGLGVLGIMLLKGVFS